MGEYRFIIFLLSKELYKLQYVHFVFVIHQLFNVESMFYPFENQ